MRSMRALTTLRLRPALGLLSRGAVSGFVVLAPRSEAESRHETLRTKPRDPPGTTGGARGFGACARFFVHSNPVVV